MKHAGRLLLSFIAALMIVGCAAQRAHDAQEAKTRMLGMSAERVLVCMGGPQRKAAEGDSEVWSYLSGDNHTGKVGVGTALGLGSSDRSWLESGGSVSRTRSCTVNIVMNNKRVVAVNYVGPSGGVFTENEQCSYATANCFEH